MRSRAPRRGQSRGQGQPPDHRFRSRLDDDLFEGQATRLEHLARATLNRLRCPTNLVIAYDIVTGSKRMTARDRREALHAMFVLVLVQKVRGHVADGNARLAAYEAFMAGSLTSNDAAPASFGRQLLRQLRTASPKGVRARREIRKARPHPWPPHFPAMVSRYRASNPDDSDRTMANVLAARIGRPVGTVRRWLLDVNRLDH